MNFKLIFAAAALLATQSFAIAGIGAHYTPNVGTKLRSADRADFKTENVNLEGKLGFSHGNFSYIQGFGFKAWVDVLPFVDIEATFNIQFASYNAALWTYDDGEPVKHPLEIELGGTPFAKATPKYIAMNADLSVTKPFSIPLFPIRPYVGGGLTFHWNTFVLNKAFVENIIDDMYEEAKAKNVDFSMDEKKLAEKVVGNEGRLVPFSMVQKVFFENKASEVSAYENEIESLTNEKNELLDSIDPEDKTVLLKDDDSGDIKADKLKAEISKIKKNIKKGAEYDEDSYESIIMKIDEVNSKLSKAKTSLKKSKKELIEETEQKIKSLTNSEIHELLVMKWVNPIYEGICDLSRVLIASLEREVDNLAQKYDTTFVSLDSQISESEMAVSNMIEELSGSDHDMRGLAQLKALLGGDL